MTTSRLEEDRHIDRVAHDWLRDDGERAPDRPEQVSQIMRRVDDTRQRHRWSPMIPFGRRAVHSAADTHRRRGIDRATGGLAPVRLLATIAVLVVGASTLLYSANLAPAPRIEVPGALPMHPADEALFERMQGMWANYKTDTSAVLDVYALDAVHTVLWQDEVERVVGASAIGDRMLSSLSLADSEARPLRLPDAQTGERRYLEVRPEAGGITCLIRIADDRITHHDCILPQASRAGRPDFPSTDPSTVADREELMALNFEGWSGDRDALEAANSPNIVHMVAFDDGVVTRVGHSELRAVANGRIPTEVLAPAIALPAPEGEMRWTDFTSLAGGTLCTFWARDGQIVRQDCIVHSRTP